ncbi:MAG: hypothetical protein JXA21_12960 [Anaerolineae bacterium]|nr:hypothetical protein [Anaerolineae bacterium]
MSVQCAEAIEETIAGANRSGLILEFEETHLGKLSVPVTFETLVTTEKGETPIEIKAGAGLQMVGLQLKDGTVLATRIS